MSSTIQIQKKKTFAEICPIWNEKIETGNMGGQHMMVDEVMRYMHLANPKCCVVGEAHGFMERYDIVNGFYDGCRDCQELSGVLFTSAMKADGPILYTKTPEFECYKDQFTEHWNKCHIK